MLYDAAAGDGSGSDSVVVAPPVASIETWWPFGSVNVYCWPEGTVTVVPAALIVKDCDTAVAAL